MPKPDLTDSLLASVAAGRDLSFDEMSSAVDGIMSGGWAEGQIADFLMALRRKGETVDEIAGAAAAMRRHMTPIRSRRQAIVDTCGTGGNASGIFNVSTSAALVAAAAGAAVAKHGNRRVTSKSGSADVLAELGVNVHADVSCVTACLDELGICFCFAPLCHAAMKHVAPVRQRLGVPTIFNLLGPLTNPAAAPYQLLGVGRDELRPPLAAALTRLGTRRAAVVHGADGLGEITIAAQTRVTEVRDGQLTQLVWSPEDFGVPFSPLDSLRVEGPAESAAIVRQVLAGERGPARDIVLVNAAAALWLSGCSETLPGATTLAGEAIDSGAASQLLERLVERTNAG
ncbi:MAG TPA: anthranilate phosphoribosyltransferase [Pirellulales bacterium]|jgi:anthranilate phosphoribosyltransferase|nr:anthranilate phosphoribosyltransferase [Pirellulales bacterium]